MPKFKPILIFIIASITLHWWVLSLPIFSRMQTFEGSKANHSPPTLVTHLNQAQPLDKTPEREKPQSQVNDESNSETTNKLVQQPPPSTFFRGSPWSRRSMENQNFNPSTPSLQNPLTQVEGNINVDISISESSSIECKRSNASNLFSCQGSSNKSLMEKIANTINTKAPESNLTLPSCITLEVIQKKWHAKACHS